MTEQPRTRQDLYDQIRQSSKEEFILDEMIRLGFWSAAGEIANDPVDEIRRRGRSIITNAQPHVGALVVINLDLQNFFPSISYRRIKGIFQAIGYSEAVATILGLICTEPDVTAVELDGKTYYIAQNQRHLPQGAPSSPALTNLLFAGSIVGSIG
jgi:Reverse transcriptase (RNA-dependent DNA polymerase)